MPISYLNLSVALWNKKKKNNNNSKKFGFSLSAGNYENVCYRMFKHNQRTPWQDFCETLKFYFVLSIRILRILFLYKYSTFHLELLTTPTLLMIQISFTFSVPDADARQYCVGMWRKQRLVYHVLNFISTVCFQLKLVSWCFYLNILTVSLAVCERQSI